MAKWTVRFAKDAARTLKKMDRGQANMLLGWIEKNLEGTDEPRQHGKALRGNLRESWRYRVGDYRLIANLDDGTVTILVLRVGHRRDVYERQG